MERMLSAAEVHHDDQTSSNTAAPSLPSPDAFLVLFFSFFFLLHKAADLNALNLIDYRICFGLYH